jgi:hypothetical protein
MEERLSLNYIRPDVKIFCANLKKISCNELPYVQILKQMWTFLGNRIKDFEEITKNLKWSFECVT